MCNLEPIASRTSDDTRFYSLVLDCGISGSSVRSNVSYVSYVSGNRSAETTTKFPSRVLVIRIAYLEIVRRYRWHATRQL